MNQKFQFMIFILANDHFIVWPSSVILTFMLPEQMFQMNNCSKLLCNPCINFEVTARTSSILAILSFDRQKVSANISEWVSELRLNVPKMHKSYRDGAQLNFIVSSERPTVKILKIGTPEIITIIVLQLEQLDFIVQYCVQKMQTE